MCKIIVIFSTCDSVDFHHCLFENTKLPPDLRKSGTGDDADDDLVPPKMF